MLLLIVPCCSWHLELVSGLHSAGAVQMEWEEGAGVAHQPCAEIYLLTDSLGCPC